jgi:hypothetical protein
VYVYKSSGLFLALTKHYVVSEQLRFGFHGSATFSFEQWRTYPWPSGYMSFEIAVFSRVFLIGEYDGALNYLGSGEGHPAANIFGGFGNVGVLFYPGGGFGIACTLKDVFEQRILDNGSKSGIGIELRLSKLFAGRDKGRGVDRFGRSGGP